MFTRSVHTRPCTGPYSIATRNICSLSRTHRYHLIKSYPNMNYQFMTSIRQFGKQMKIYNTPAVSDCTERINVLEWFNKPGDKVEALGIIGKGSYEKADIDILAPYDAIVHKILVPAGDRAIVGKPLVQFQVDDDDCFMEEEQQLNEENLYSIAMKLDNLLMDFRDIDRRMIETKRNTNIEFVKILKEIEALKKLIDQEQKQNDRIDLLMKEMEMLKENIRDLSTGIINNMNPEKQKLKSWLEQQVKLPEYYDIFIQCGVDDLKTAGLITLDTLKDIGIDKIGHQMKIMNHVNQLISKQNNNE